MAKYPYIVNRDGIWYQSGVEVPDTTNSEVKEEKAENKANIKPQEVSEIEVNDDDKNARKLVEVFNGKAYTKTEINRMPLAELKVLAKENGLDDDRNGAELKKTLIEKFGL